MSQNKKTVILDLRDSPWVDGPGRTTLETAVRIDRDRYEIIIGGFSGGTQKTDEYLKEAERRGLRVVRLEEKGALDPGVVSQILKLVDTVGVDIIHAHEFRSNVFGLICARRRRLPVITTCHGWIANNAKGKIKVLLDRMLLYFFDHIVVVSRKLEARLRRQGIGSSRISALSNAVAFENFDSIPDDRTFRAELGVGPDTVLVANIGRLSPEKGQGEFIRSAAAVVRESTDIRFLLVGIGPDQAALERLTRELGLDGQVVFLGYRADMARIYRSLDLVVQSSFTEGMPNVILEAAAMGVPIIATDVGGTSEIIRNQEEGILIPPGDTEGLGTAIIRFLQDKPGYREMARRASISVRNRYSYTSRTNAMAEIYDRLMAERTSGHDTAVDGSRRDIR